MKRFALILGVGLSACAPKPVDVAGVRIASAADVVMCDLKGTVVGTPGVFGPLKEHGLQDARKRALQLAPNLGADTVVFDPVGDEPIVTQVSGSAYDCSAG